MDNAPRPDSAAAPLPSKSPNILRGAIFAAMVAVILFNRWQDRAKRADTQSTPAAVATQDDSPASSSGEDSRSMPTGIAQKAADVSNDSPIESVVSSLKEDARFEATTTDTEKPKPTDSTIKSNSGTTKANTRGPPVDSLKPVASANKPNESGQPRVDGLKVHNVVIKNLDDEIVFRGTIDLTKTIERIDAQRVLSEYRHDGIEFKNFERRLPSKGRGHYREWVHPTNGQRGPGPQRVITGKDGEAYYTWDHYEHFVRIRGPK